MRLMERRARTLATSRCSHREGPSPTASTASWRSGRQQRLSKETRQDEASLYFGPSSPSRSKVVFCRKLGDEFACKEQHQRMTPSHETIHSGLRSSPAPRTKVPQTYTPLHSSTDQEDASASETSSLLHCYAHRHSRFARAQLPNAVTTRWFLRLQRTRSRPGSLFMSTAAFASAVADAVEVAIRAASASPFRTGRSAMSRIRSLTWAAAFPEPSRLVLLSI
jgi:hypothetical protein